MPEEKVVGEPFLPGYDKQPDWSGNQQITVSELAFLKLRAGREDYRRVIAALEEFGGINVVPDPP